MQKLRVQHLSLFVVVWSVIGFPLLVSITTILDLNNTTYAILMRGLAFFASVVMMFGALRIHHRLAFLLFLVFWIAYFFRLYISQFIIGEQTVFAPQSYWIWGIGASFVPGLAVLASYRSIWSTPLPRAFSLCQPDCHIASAEHWRHKHYQRQRRIDRPRPVECPLTESDLGRPPWRVHASHRASAYCTLAT